MTDADAAERVLVLMPSTLDAERTAGFLGEAGISPKVCADLDDLCRQMRVGAAAVLTTDDALVSDVQGRIADVLLAEPAWSSLPFVVIAREGRTSAIQEHAPDAMTALVVVERPVRASSLLSVLRSSLRARRHQYLLRDAMLAQEAQTDALARQAAALTAQEEQLRDADRRKDEFLATLAHELRNPLAPLRTGLEVLKATTTGEGNQHTLGVMSRQLGHMVRLIDDLLDVSRITRGKLELKRERIAIGAAVDAAVEANRPALEAAGHELTVDVSDRELALDADPTRIAQVIGNLLSNACKYTPPRGRLGLSVRSEGRDVVVEVSDTGVGLAPERLEDVFEMFNQVEAAIDRAQGGLGIGLALVKQFVELHGGTVEVRSPGVGRGSTFTVRLPRATPASTSAPPEESARAKPNGRRRVLVVDDNLDAAELLSLMLEQAGYEASTAEDGPGALAEISARDPQIVILDIGLPGMSGYEVAREVRRRSPGASPLLVALTGWGSAEDKQRASAAGFDAHLTKPVDGAALFGALDRLSARARA